jgi:hypothetical protein
MVWTTIVINGMHMMNFYKDIEIKDCIMPCAENYIKDVEITYEGRLMANIGNGSIDRIECYLSKYDEAQYNRFVFVTVPYMIHLKDNKGK